MKRIVFALLLIFSISVFGKGEVKILFLDFYADFKSKEIKKAGYYDVNGLKVKLPAKIKEWLANELFDIPPEEIIVKGRIKNSGTRVEKEKFDVEIRFKVSKIVNNENGEMNIEKSERNKYWDTKIINKKIEVENIKSGKIGEYELFKLDLTKMHYEYVSKDIYPWLCEVMIINEKKEKIIKNIEIGLVW